ncbi:FAD-dependent oxidoreductase [Kribbella sp. CA-294648]|uniref:FAD-dependent oxidoreductase n=1 Tax=Kribbella sp. CA-294648 TaxID=3239948 RepID=UPI003D907558
MRTYDVVVIGAGAMGSAAARAVAAAGREVLVLEQYELGHVRGGSHGGTRLFRLAIDDEGELLRAARARELWEELESETGVQMLDPVGGVDHGLDEHQVGESAALLERQRSRRRRSSRGSSRRWMRRRRGRSSWIGGSGRTGCSRRGTA